MASIASSGERAHTHLTAFRAFKQPSKRERQQPSHGMASHANTLKENGLFTACTAANQAAA